MFSKVKSWGVVTQKSIENRAPSFAQSLAAKAPNSGTGEESVECYRLAGSSADNLDFLLCSPTTPLCLILEYDFFDLIIEQ